MRECKFKVGDRVELKHEDTHFWTSLSVGEKCEVRSEGEWVTEYQDFKYELRSLDVDGRIQRVMGNDLMLTKVELLPCDRVTLRNGEVNMVVNNQWALDLCFDEKDLLLSSSVNLDNFNHKYNNRFDIMKIERGVDDEYTFDVIWERKELKECQFKKYQFKDGDIVMVKDDVTYNAGYIYEHIGKISRVGYCEDELCLLDLMGLMDKPLSVYWNYDCLIKIGEIDR